MNILKLVWYYVVYLWKKLFHSDHNDLISIGMKNYLEQPLGRPVTATVEVNEYRDQLMSTGDHAFIHIPGLEVRVRKGSVVHKTWSPDPSAPVKIPVSFSFEIPAATERQTYDVEYRIGSTQQWTSRGSFDVSWKDKEETGRELKFDVTQTGNTGLECSDQRPNLRVTAYNLIRYNDGSSLKSAVNSSKLRVTIGGVTKEVPFNAQSVVLGGDVAIDLPISILAGRHVGDLISSEDGILTGTVSLVGVDVPEKNIRFTYTDREEVMPEWYVSAKVQDTTHFVAAPAKTDKEVVDGTEIYVIK